MGAAAVQYLTPDELVERWKRVVNKGALANWRAATPRRGPAFVKIGSKVLYPIDAVTAWEQQNLKAANDNSK